MPAIASSVRNKMKGYQQALRFTFRMAISCVLALGIGIYADDHLHTSPLFLIGLLVYAMIGNLYLLVKECGKDE